MRLLFFPWPVGAGHVGRCIVAARHLRTAGHYCAFMSDPSGGGVAREGFATLGAAPSKPPLLPDSGYLVIAGLDAAFAGFGYYSAARVRRDLSRVLASIREAAPDVVVTHMDPIAAIAARIEGLPLASIAEADFLRAGANTWMPWTRAAEVHRSPWPTSLPAFNRVLEEQRLPRVADVTELLSGDATLVASTPEYDPMPDTVDAEYVGPLIWSPDDIAMRSALGALPRGSLRVYVTGGSGAVADRMLMAAASEAGIRCGWSCVLAAGYDARHDQETVGDQILHWRFGGLDAALGWADVVVSHGGHSTMLAAARAGIPHIVVPAMSENEANGRSMLHGAGVLLHHTVMDDDGVVQIVPRYPTAGINSPSAEGIIRAVSEVTEGERFRNAAARGARLLAPWGQATPGLVVAALERVAS